MRQCPEGHVNNDNAGSRCAQCGLLLPGSDLRATSVSTGLAATPSHPASSAGQRSPYVPSGPSQRPYRSLEDIDAKLRRLIAVWTTLGAIGFCAAFLNYLSVPEAAGLGYILVATPVLMNLLVIVVWVVTFVVFLGWLHGLCSNQRALGGHDPRLSPDEAVAGALIPLANLFLVQRTFNAVWRTTELSSPAAEMDELSSRPIRAGPITWWWAVGLGWFAGEIAISVVLVDVLGWERELLGPLVEVSTTMTETEARLGYLVWSTLFGLILVGAMFVQSVTSRLTTRQKQLSMVLHGKS